MQNDRSFDKMLHSWFSQFSGWLSPVSAHMALTDWCSHLAISPQEVCNIVQNAQRKWLRFLLYQQEYFTNKECAPCVQCRLEDKRFQNALWQQFPFNFYSQGFLLCEQLWDESTDNIWGTTKHHQYIINFSGRQILDMMAPSNFPLTNPEILAATVQQSGQNIINGFKNLSDDIYRRNAKLPPLGAENFKVGINVAVTPGKVVFRNNLIELIQYTPTTKQVYAEPLLIVPAWIMKYYILDLSPHNSMVKYLVDQGHTVFMISWKNPNSEDRNLGMEDYIELGIMAALEAMNHIVPDQKVHAVGYCIGGTLLSIAAAAMAGRSDARLKTITLFAAQVDFKDAGELLLFIDESQISYLEDIMSEKGYLDGSRMGGAFSLLNSIDMIWSRMINNYYIDDSRPLNDLMAWDYDTTRLPYKMHSEYLRRLFLTNDLVEGRYSVKDQKISLLDIDVPMFVVSTLTDHVAPCISVYKIHLFVETDITFVQTNGGHNAGIVSEPGHPHRAFQMSLHKKDDKYINLATWQEKAPHFDGSWWPEWHKWLASNSTADVSPPTLGNPTAGYKIICDAPGIYVLVKGDPENE